MTERSDGKLDGAAQKSQVEALWVRKPEDVTNEEYATCCRTLSM